MGHVRAFYTYINRFGPRAGLGVWFATLKATGLLRLSPGKGMPPLFLRSRSTDVAVFDEVFVHQAYMTEKLRRLRPQTIIDAGANIGLTSIYFANAFPGTRIFSIEPEKSNFELLRRNVAGYPQITPINAAVWHSDTQVEVIDPGAGFWSFRVQDRNDGPGASGVPGIKVRALCRQYGIKSIDVFKIDIEGAEEPLFREGCFEWLDITKNLIIELHDRFNQGCARRVYAALTQYSFSQEIKGKNIFVSITGARESLQSNDVVVSHSVAI
jgi:FkbM family methyltransferase